tara:strand:+ start:201 stop:353 length:153 start_codon:yes stop_codon:yes gene_type:complete
MQNQRTCGMVFTVIFIVLNQIVIFSRSETFPDLGSNGSVNYTCGTAGMME